MTVEHERATAPQGLAASAQVEHGHTLTFDARIRRALEVIERALIAAGVLVLVVALWLVRQQSGRGRPNDAPGLLQGEDG